MQKNICFHFPNFFIKTYFSCIFIFTLLLSLPIHIILWWYQNLKKLNFCVFFKFFYSSFELSIWIGFMFVVSKGERLTLIFVDSLNKLNSAKLLEQLMISRVFSPWNRFTSEKLEDFSRIWPGNSSNFSSAML